MIILLNMILSSGLLFLMFLIQRRWFHHLLDFQMQCGLLKICFIFLLLPFPLIIIGFRIFLFYQFGDAGQYSFSSERPLIIFTEQTVLLNDSAYDVTLVMMLYLAIVCAVTLHHAISYFLFLKRIKQSIEDIEDQQIISALCQKKNQLKIKSPVRLYKSRLLHVAFTTGVLKPIIIVPAETEGKDLDLMIIHELVHIKKKDVLFRIIAYICTTLYWFNPFIYAVLYHYNQTSELACDEYVVQIVGSEDKKRYAQLILEAAGERNSKPLRYLSFFSHKAFIKRRIECIMKKDNSLSRRKKLSALIAVLMVIFSCIPALAAPAPQMLLFGKKLQDKVINPNFDLEISVDGADKKYAVKAIPVIYDEQVILENGDILPAEQSDRVICNHKFTSVVYTVHERKSDGGCTLQEYQADRCTNCGYLDNQVFILEQKYVVCPH